MYKMCFIVIHILYNNDLSSHLFVACSMEKCGFIGLYSVSLLMYVKVFLLEYEFNMKDTNYYLLVHCNYTCKFF